MKKSLALAFSLGMLLSVSSPMHAEGGALKLGLGVLGIYAFAKVGSMLPNKKLRAFFKTPLGYTTTTLGLLVVAGAFHAMTREKK